MLEMKIELLIPAVAQTKGVGGLRTEDVNVWVFEAEKALQAGL